MQGTGGGDLAVKASGLKGHCTELGECTGLDVECDDDCDLFLLSLYGTTGGGTLFFVLNNEYCNILSILALFLTH